MVRSWSAFETSKRGTSFVQSRHGARNRSNLVTIPPPPFRPNWAAYIMVPDSPAYTIGLELPSGFRTAEQMWDIDLGYWNRAVATIPPDEFVRPGVVHLGRSAVKAPSVVVPSVQSQGEYDELFVFPWAAEDPVPDRIWPQSRPFPPDIVLAGRPGEPTYKFGNHQAPFDAYYSFIGQPQLVAFSVSHYGRPFWADPSQYGERGGGETNLGITSGNINFDWAGWFNAGIDSETPGPQMMPWQTPDGDVLRGHIRGSIGDDVFLFDNVALRAFGPGEPEFQFDRSSILYREHDIDEGKLPELPPYDTSPNNFLPARPFNRHRWLKDLAWQLAPGSFGGE